jgi:uncharacterized membrane protein required for colicin V production
VTEHLKAPATRRTTLAALVVFTGNDAYRQATGSMIHMVIGVSIVHQVSFVNQPH